MSRNEPPKAYKGSHVLRREALIVAAVSGALELGILLLRPTSLLLAIVIPIVAGNVWLYFNWTHLVEAHRRRGNSLTENRP